MSQLTETLLGNAPFGARFAAFRTRMAEDMAKRKIYRRTVRELGALSDRDLADLGLHRSHIRQIAQTAAYGG